MKLKNVKSLLAAALCAVGLSAAAGLVPVEYLDWDDVGKEMTNAVCTAYTVVTADMAAFDAGKTYVVMDDVSVSSRITVEGTVANPTRLILCDGTKLTASAGVKVTVSGATTNALVICGQTLGTGALEATGGLRTAGIGGLSNDTPGESGIGGTVTINGGMVTATGGNCAAGIGGGWGGHGGTVTINGGTVTAKGVTYGAGIGGGLYGAGGNVSINGGTVTATAGTDGGEAPTVAIGCCQESGDNGTVTFGAGMWLVKAGNAAPGDDMTAEAYAADHSAKYVHIELPPEISAVSAEGFLDLTVGDRIAKDVEPLVVDPAWGEASEAWVKLQKGWLRTYTCASNDTWDTTAITPGRYSLAFHAGEGDAAVFYGANFWKLGDDWVVFDSSNITADVTFEAGKTYLFFGTNTVAGTLTVQDGAKFFYDEGAPSGFRGEEPAELPKRYGKEIVEDGLYQIVEKIKGCEDNPWEIGEGVTAYTNGTELVIGGAGTITNLAEVAKDGLTAITIAEVTVTGAESVAFQGIDNISLTLPDGWQGELPDDEGNWYGATGVTLETYPLTVRNVTSQQRYPWNGLVDISCGLTGAGEVTLSATVLTNGAEFIEAQTFIGETTIDLGDGCETNGVKFVWNAAADLPAGFKAKDVQLKVTAEQ